MDDVMKKVKKKLSRLKKATVYDFGETKETFSLLEEIFKKECGNPKTMDGICAVLLKHDFLKTVVTIWKQINKSVGNQELYHDLGSKRNAFMLVKNTIWNYSDRCYGLCRACYEDSDLILLLIDDLRKFTSDLKKLDDPCVRHHMSANFGILHNLLRQYADNKDHISRNDRVKVVARYASSEYLMVRAYSYFVSAYCTEKDEPKSLLPGEEELKFILDVLSEALLVSPNHIHEKYGLSAAEVTEAIDMLAVNDSNKEHLVHLGILTLLVSMLNDKMFSENEILKSLRCIWTLTLSKYSKTFVLKEQNLIDKLRQLSVNDNESNQWRASLIYTLTPHTTPTRKHVMLSYQWDNQDVIKQLYDYLDEQGFEVWMDLRKMKGSINDCMAEGVENAAIVIMSVTKKYNESRQTKKEAEYADDRQIPMLPLHLEDGYKPHKWLGVLTAGKLYVKISVSEPTTNFPDVKKQILALVPEMKQSLSKCKK